MKKQNDLKLSALLFTLVIVFAFIGESLVNLILK